MTALPSVAGTDVEVLAVDQRFLQRVQRRYPRIASKVFLNLTGVLSDRLERTRQHAVAATTEDRDADPAPAACWHAVAAPRAPAPPLRSLSLPHLGQRDPEVAPVGG